jgi:hypothetical protein
LPVDGPATDDLVEDDFSARGDAFHPEWNYSVIPTKIVCLNPKLAQAKSLLPPSGPKVIVDVDEIPDRLDAFRKGSSARVALCCDG